MKKAIAPILMFATVLLASLLCMRYTFVCQEYEGLFLNTPDWWARAWAQQLPVSGIISDFLTQFYRDPLYGAIITAVLITGVFLLLRGILCRFGLSGNAIAAFASGALWVFVAHSSTSKPAVFVLLLMAAAWLLSLLFKIKQLRKERKADLPLSSVMLVAAAACVVLSPAVMRAENFNRVKVDALYGIWDDLLATVPPEEAEKNAELTPFALLALSGKGELGDKMFTYPVFEQNDLDMEAYDGKGEYYTSLLFKACLYQYLGCYNEAIHNYFQWSTQLRQGTSFVVLRRLAELYCLQGNYDLMEKYCRILDKSLLNGAYVRHFRAMATKGTAQQPTSVQDRAAMPVISHDPLYNLVLLQSSGFDTRMSADRMLCTLILKKDFIRFGSIMEVLAPAYEHIPLHFQEVMVFAGLRSFDVDAAVVERYSAFVSDMMDMPQERLFQLYKGSAFPFLFSE
ncbi:MAG: hypothetical protein J5695_00100 [Bacteroidales bacterium]|nr:hypothetical protein [Bacteroidales bacterium]